MNHIYKDMNHTVKTLRCLHYKKDSWRGGGYLDLDGSSPAWQGLSYLYQQINLTPILKSDEKQNAFLVT